MLASGHSCCLPGNWEGLRERSRVNAYCLVGVDPAEIKAKTNLVCTSPRWTMIGGQVLLEMPGDPHLPAIPLSLPDSKPVSIGKLILCLHLPFQGQ